MTKTIEKAAFNRKEGAAYLGLALNTFINLLNTGKLHYVRAGKRILIPKSSLDDFLMGKPIEERA